MKVLKFGIKLWGTCWRSIFIELKYEVVYNEGVDVLHSGFDANQGPCLKCWILQII